MIHDYLQTVVDGGDDVEHSIEEFKRLSGHGHSHAQFNHEEIHER
jgi:hypothetical protein